jgi:AcrR family transcriptional regulator
MSTPSSPSAAPLTAGDGHGVPGSAAGSAATRTTAAGSERPLSEQGRERQQQLIDAAVALFSERGYAATRVRDICDRAGVAKGLFYWYFPTKLHLFAELVRTMRRRLRRAQAAAMHPDADALTRLRQGTVASVVFMAEHAAYFALVDLERADPTIADTLRAGSQVYLDDVTALLREAQRAGLVIDSDPHVLALGVLGAVSSYSNAWRAGRIDMTHDQLAEFVAGWVERALR